MLQKCFRCARKHSFLTCNNLFHKIPPKMLSSCSRNTKPEIPNQKYQTSFRCAQKHSFLICNNLFDKNPKKNCFNYVPEMLEICSKHAIEYRSYFPRLGVYFYNFPAVPRKDVSPEDCQKS
jgi:hypothetical protein